ncbi:MAG: hypothetical protein LBR63_14565 [Citrobacter amalonaticus]|nr:hypothetical protein [Citrobacter amalonaticus]
MADGIPSACPRARRCTLLRIVTALPAKSGPAGRGVTRSLRLSQFPAVPVMCFLSAPCRRLHALRA